MLNYISGKAREQNSPGKFQFLVWVNVLFSTCFIFFKLPPPHTSPPVLRAGMMNIVPLINKRAGRSPRDQGNGGWGGGGEEQEGEEV